MYFYPYLNLNGVALNHHVSVSHDPASIYHAYPKLLSRAIRSIDYRYRRQWLANQSLAGGHFSKALALVDVDLIDVRAGLNFKQSSD